MHRFGSGRGGVRSARFHDIGSLARLALHATGGVIDMDEAHAGPIDQIDCVSGSVHRRAKTLQAVLALLPLCFNYFERLLVFEIVEGKGQVGRQDPYR